MWERQGGRRSGTPRYAGSKATRVAEISLPQSLTIIYLTQVGLFNGTTTLLKILHLNANLLYLLTTGLRRKHLIYYILSILVNPSKTIGILLDGRM